MILEAKDLTKTFRDPLTLKKKLILKNVTFRVPEASTVGFLGLNGAGKTTTIKCLMGLITQDSGEIKYFGSSNWGKSEKSKIGYLPERPYFYEYLTGKEFLSFYADLSGLKDKKNKIEALLEKVGLEGSGEASLRNYSKGMLQRIGLAQALIHDPELFVLDEPMSGLDPDGRKDIIDIMRDIKKQKKTIFFSSHLLDDVEKLCDYLVIIHGGQIVYEGTLVNFLNKFPIGWEISYLKNQKIEKIESIQLSSVQQEIDNARKQGLEIVEVSKRGLDLENAFYQFRQSLDKNRNL